MDSLRQIQHRSLPRQLTVSGWPWRARGSSTTYQVRRRHHGTYLRRGSPEGIPCIVIAADVAFISAFLLFPGNLPVRVQPAFGARRQVPGRRPVTLLDRCHVDEAAVVALECDRHSSSGTVPVLSHNEVGLAGARGLALVSVLAVQEDDDVRVLLD